MGDLDDRLKFGTSYCVLTNTRFFVLNATENPAKPSVGSWEVQQLSGLRAKEQAGLGTLELLGPDGRLTAVRYTSSRGSAAARFVQSCNSYLAELRGEKLEAIITVCPSCGAVLNSGETECPSCSTVNAAETKSLYRMLQFARPYSTSFIIGFFLTIAGNVATLGWLYLTARLIDDVIISRPDAPREGITFAAASPYLSALLVMAFLAWIFNWIKSYLIAKVTEYVVSDIRTATYNHLQKLSLEYFGGKRTGDIMSRVSSDSDRINQFLSVQLMEFSTNVIFILIATATLISIDPWLSLVTLAPFPLIAWSIQIARARLRQGFALGSRAWSELVSVLADTIPGIRVVKAFAQESREIARFREVDQNVVAANIRVNGFWACFTPLITFLTDIGVLVIWAFGVWRIADGAIGVGNLILFVSAISRFYSHLESMSRMVALVQRASVATHRIFEILDRTPSVAEPVKPVEPGRVKGRIELKAVRFSYGKREVIKGIDLIVEPGEMIGLVGPSGAGKSTLVNLVCRFFDVASGGIFVDDMDIRSFPTSAYRRNIGIVLQDPFLFYGTIAENIAYGRPNASRSEIIAAAKAAKAHEFILRLQDGYDSIVGERGQALSGGERQRISIARALLTDPRILILDEATSSVDTETEREIQEALDNLTRGRTTLAIAHRLSTLRNANRIVVLESGQITECGSHDELLKQAGTYARLCQSQNDLSQ
jgi:ATP-binding cassette subfamily B protein